MDFATLAEYKGQCLGARAVRRNVPVGGNGPDIEGVAPESVEYMIIVSDDAQYIYTMGTGMPTNKYKVNDLGFIMVDQSWGPDPAKMFMLLKNDDKPCMLIITGGEDKGDFYECEVETGNGATSAEMIEICEMMMGNNGSSTDAGASHADTAIQNALSNAGASLKTMAQALSDMPAEMREELAEECGDKDIMLRWAQLILLPASNVGSTKFGTNNLGELIPELMQDSGLQEPEFMELITRANASMSDYDMFIETIKTLRLYLDQGSLINISKWQYTIMAKTTIIPQDELVDAILKYWTGKIDEEKLLEILGAFGKGFDMMNSFQDTFAVLGDKFKDSLGDAFKNLGESMQNGENPLGNLDLGNLDFSKLDFGNLGNLFGAADDVEDNTEEQK